VNTRVVVSVPLILLLLRKLPKGLRDIASSILATDHESNLARRVGRDGGVSIFGNREDLTARLLQLCNEREVQPLILGYISTIETLACRTNSKRQGWSGKFEHKA